MNQQSPFPTPSMYNDVAVFHCKVLNQMPSEPHLPSKWLANARRLFMQEELNEFNDACANEDIVGAADALADLVYVALGTAYLMGLPMMDIWNAVQKANMSKVPGVTKRGMANDATKPDGWVGPEAEIAGAINAALT